MRSPARSPARSSIPLPKWRPRRTLIDLYTEKDRTPWYWRLSAITAAFMIMLGFLIFPSAFFENTSSVNRTSATVVSSVFLAIGCITSGALYFLCKSWMFRLDCVFGPCLSSCIFGLFNIIYNLNIHPNSKPHLSASSIIALALATISTLVYTIFTLLTFRKVHTVRSRDAMHRHTTDGEALLPEDEMQRQQLLRLLLQRDGKKISNELSQSTYRIDLPDAPRRVTTHLSAPENVYGYENRPSRSRSAPMEPFRERNQTSPEAPSVHVQAPTLTFNNPFPQYVQETTPLAENFDQNIQGFHQNTFPPVNGFEPAAQDWARNPRSPTNGYDPHAHDLGIDGLVNTHYRNPSLPSEKQEALNRQLSSRHPAERPNYHIADPPIPQILASYTPQTVEEINRLSRESRRTEIELEDRGRDKKRRADVDIEGVEFTPRIQRVTTDGWGKP